MDVDKPTSSLSTESLYHRNSKESSMEQKLNYVIGLDIGIGSVGWAAINLDKRRIEDFGVRLFDSGEDTRQKERKSQQRRGYRSARRLVRRRAHRTVRLRQLFDKIGLVSADVLDRYYQNPTANPLELRVRGLTDKLSPAELAAALLHIGKHRGFNEFYSLHDEEKKLLSKDEKNDLTRAEAYETLKKSMPDMTPAQLYLSHPMFMSEFGVRYRNTKKQDESKKVLVPRSEIEKETHRICEKQAAFYPCLTEQNREKIYEILFRQRDFEDGPGDPNDETRPYKGFLETIGNCRFYPELKRGARQSVLGDLFVLINRLSQNRYFNAETGEVVDSADAYREIIEKALLSGSLEIKEAEKILKRYGTEMLNTNDKSADSPNRCLAFIRMIKPILEKNGFIWEDIIRAEYPFAPYREDSFLNQVGKILSENRTPQRRVNLLKQAGISDAVAKALANRKTSGTVSVSNRYMLEAVEAFMNGELFGAYNARREKELLAETRAAKKYKKLPPIEEGDYIDNPVVFRSINETRKVLNAVIEKYGSPNAINIEIAAELSRTFDERDRMNREKTRNEKENKRLQEQIAELLHTKDEIMPTQVERYRLGESQGWKCPYCGASIVMETAIRRDDHSYEIDHIIPYSLILDNTLHNKVLVHHGCNQAKGQRTPLMYLGNDAAKKADFVKWVNAAFNKDCVSKRKREYLLQPDLNDERMHDWKTRNLNDTRYIAKYLVRYLNENLLFDSEEKTNVYAVKGAITSQLRRVWLNKETWGCEDKTGLRKESNLHHAVDAVVIANCMPGYIELAEEALRLRRMYHEEGKRETEKWTAVLNNAVDRLYRYYCMPKVYAEQMLRNIKRIPSFIPNLREEVDTRFCGCGLENEAGYRSKIRTFYRDDPAFAAQIRMPLVSYKPNRKATGKVTADKAVKKGASQGLLVKKIAEDNTTTLDDASYYCTEVYRRKDGTLGLRGIRYSMLKKMQGKIVLADTLQEDYATHEVYLFKNDYIRIYDKNNKIKFEGYYLSVYDMKAQRIYTADRTKGRNEKSMGILKNDRVEKLDVSILGDLGGIVPCGKPFLSEMTRS